jgi:hypothetical protein
VKWRSFGKDTHFFFFFFGALPPNFFLAVASHLALLPGFFLYLLLQVLRALDSSWARSSAAVSFFVPPEVLGVGLPGAFSVALGGAW